MINPDETGTTKQKFALLKADNTIIYDETKNRSSVSYSRT